MELPDLLAHCSAAWSEGGDALEGLKALIRVPNLSPEYDPEFFTNGLIEQAVSVTRSWIESQGIPGLVATVFADPGREPLLLVEIPASKSTSSVLVYGHLDKMPHLDPAGWAEGLSATNPVVRDGKLYGRGANDDAYASFLFITALKYAQLRGLPYPRVVMVLETGEESGDEEITAYLRELRPRIGDIDVILVLDGGSEDYSTAWLCSSLRGVLIGVLDVQHLAAPCHSGMATGIVPSTFRIARLLLGRLEDEATGEILLPEAHAAEVPRLRIAQLTEVANHLGSQITDIGQLVEGGKYLSDDIAKMTVDRAWKPGLEVTGADGIPKVSEGSNVIRVRTALKLSLRIPPGVSGPRAQDALKRLLEADPPYGAKVVYTPNSQGGGWACPVYPEKLEKAFADATKAVFGTGPMYIGNGASIPLCNLLQELWENASILVTGAAGNIDGVPHGYNENLDLEYTKKFTAVIAGFITAL
jgi:acetylornithine deacetylase/succinyl-diaminopimelate desuccinylase-like protein